MPCSWGVSITSPTGVHLGCPWYSVHGRSLDCLATDTWHVKYAIIEGSFTSVTFRPKVPLRASDRGCVRLPPGEKPAGRAWTCVEPCTWTETVNTITRAESAV